MRIRLSFALRARDLQNNLYRAQQIAPNGREG